MKATIIGAGISGLTVGACLAQEGHQVTVFDQNPVPGGVAVTLEKGGFKWDLGQLTVEGLGPDEPVGLILAELNLTDKLPYRKEDRGYVFPDFDLKKPVDYQGIHWRLQRLKKLFPEDTRGLDRYWRDYLRFTSVMTFARRMEWAKNPLLANIAKIRMFLALLPLLPKLSWSAQRLMESYFKSEKLRCVFTSILADFFTPPSQFQGLGVFAINPESSFESRMPKTLAPDTETVYYYSIFGGISRLSDILADKIIACGGQVITGRTVTKVCVEGGRAVGVVDDNGTRHDSDVVVASGGAKELFCDLVGDEYLPDGFTDKVSDIPLMESVFMVHLGLDFDPSSFLHGVTTYFYGSYDIEGEIVSARSGKYHEGRAGFVVHLPTLHSPEMAPAGCHSMTIYTICPDILAEGSWSDLKERYADQLIKIAEQKIPGLSQHTRTRMILTPEDFRRRAFTKHSAFGGIAPIMGAWSARHRTPVEGLWFVGAQSESGGGVCTIIQAAHRTAKAILKSAG